MRIEYEAICVHEMFAKKASSSPDAIALMFRQRAVTYRELDRRSNQLARHLMNLGVRRGSLVAICVERSIELVVGLLAIWKAGAAYVPLDPTYPDDRLQFMLNDSCASIVVTQHALKAKTAAARTQVLVDDDSDVILEADDEPFSSGATVEDLAYVIYTSGSTGQPKGVMITHRNLANFFAGMDRELPGPPGVWLSVTSVSFDISVLELFWTLIRGYQVAIASLESVDSLASQENTPSEVQFSLMYFATDESSEGEKYKLLLDGARFADRNGFHAIWTPERHFHAFGGLFPNPSVLSAAVAMITERLQIRAGSVVLPLHDPIRVAEEWSIVDNLSAGRVGISFASGWHERDFVFAPGNFDERRDILFRNLQTVQRLWRGESVQRTTGAGREADVAILPRPVQKELPVWVTAAGDPETFRRGGESGANVLTHLLGQSLEQVANNISIYRKSRAASHPEAGPGHVTLMVHTFVGENMEKVRLTARDPLCRYLKSSVGLMRQAVRSLGHEFSSGQLSTDDLESLIDHAFDRYFLDSGLFGTPESCLKRVEQFRAIGVDEIACLVDFGVEPQALMEGLERLAELRHRGSDSVDKSLTIPEQISRYKVNSLQCTPSLARMILLTEGGPNALSKLDCLCVGGEAMSVNLAAELERLVPGRIWNMYGPTETTVWSTTHRLRDGDEPIPIGKPIANTRAYVVDENLRLVPSGQSGELLLGGDGVAQGYLNRSELTDERFLPDPSNPSEGRKVYRTGDIVRQRADGSLVYLGRLDHQVKIRGHRVELGEVEASLESHPDVDEAAVVVATARADDPSLDAYVVLHKHSRASAGELKRYLTSKLPVYMVPTTISFLPSLPLTPNGKTDRNQLVALKQDRANGLVSPPGNLTEEKLVRIWADILEAPGIGTHDNFFELGGNSLSAVQVTFRIREVFGVSFSLASFLEEPTVVGQARLLEHLTTDVQPDNHLAEILSEVNQLTEEEAREMLREAD